MPIVVDYIYENLWYGPCASERRREKFSKWDLKTQFQTKATKATAVKNVIENLRHSIVTFNGCAGNFKITADDSQLSLKINNFKKACDEFIKGLNLQITEVDDENTIDEDVRKDVEKWMKPSAGEGFTILNKLIESIKELEKERTLTAIYIKRPLGYLVDALLAFAVLFKIASLITTLAPLVVAGGSSLATVLSESAFTLFNSYERQIRKAIEKDVETAEQELERAPMRIYT